MIQTSNKSGRQMLHYVWQQPPCSLEKSTQGIDILRLRFLYIDGEPYQTLSEIRSGAAQLTFHVSNPRGDKTSA